MTVRRLKESDLPELLHLYTFLHDEPLVAEQGRFARTWTDIQAQNNIAYFGAFRQGELVSACNIAIIANLTHGCRPYALIENVVTHAEYRNRGLGKAVLQAALDWAWAGGCYKTMLMTGRLREDVLGFYRSAGFDDRAKQAFIARPA